MFKIQSKYEWKRKTKHDTVNSQNAMKTAADTVYYKYSINDELAGMTLTNECFSVVSETWKLKNVEIGIVIDLLECTLLGPNI